MKSKNYFFSICVILFCSIVVSMSSCKKENDSISSEQTINKENLITATEPMRTLYENTNGHIVYGCAEPPGNCLPTVIITPVLKSSNAYLKTTHDDFIEKFKSNKVADFFNNGDYLTLFPQIIKLPEALEGLKKSDIVLYHKIGTNDEYDYYIGLPKSVKFSSDWKGLEKCVFVINNK